MAQARPPEPCAAERQSRGRGAGAALLRANRRGAKSESAKSKVGLANGASTGGAWGSVSCHCQAGSGWETGGGSGPSKRLEDLNLGTPAREREFRNQAGEADFLKRSGDADRGRGPGKQQTALCLRQRAGHTARPRFVGLSPLALSFLWLLGLSSTGLALIWALIRAISGFWQDSSALPRGIETAKLGGDWLKMRIVLCDTPEEAVSFTVARIARLLAKKPEAVLGLATGGTMEPVYQGLVAAHQTGLSFAKATSFNLDEYVGLTPDHPQSYRYYMQQHLFGQVDMDPSRVFVPRGDLDPREAAAEYEREIASRGPIDLQLLGLGHNGHIGFNEPGSSLASRTRDKALTLSTREANARYFGPDEAQPVEAVTMGIGTIMDAREVLILAVGAGKAGAVRGVAEGPVTTMCPGSALQFHQNVTLVVDEAAGAGLVLKDHYREAEAMHIERD